MLALIFFVFFIFPPFSPTAFPARRRRCLAAGVSMAGGDQAEVVWAAGPGPPGKPMLGLFPPPSPPRALLWVLSGWAGGEGAAMLWGREEEECGG